MAIMLRPGLNAVLNSTNLHELSSCEERRLTGLVGSAEAFFTATPGGNNGCRSPLGKTPIFT